MIAKDQGQGDYKQPETGAVAANIFKVVDLGTQEGEWQGKPKKHRQVIIGWEIDQYMDDGRPYTVREIYTLNLGDRANLRKIIEGLKGCAFTPEEATAGYDLSQLLDQPCLVTLTANKVGNVHVTGVSRLPKNFPQIERVNPAVYFDLDAFNQATFDGLSAWDQGKIMLSPEYAKATGKPQADPASAEGKGPATPGK